APDDPPTNITLTPRSRSFTATLNSPRKPNGIISTYESNIHNLDTGENKLQNYTVLFTNTLVSIATINITDLEPFTNYSITVRAYTSGGESPWSGASSKPTLEA
ncbi:unnamed protein product, partial [Owenia fusiformis]